MTIKKEPINKGKQFLRIPKIYFSFQITAIFLNVFIGITSKIIKPSIAIRIDNDIAKSYFS